MHETDPRNEELIPHSFFPKFARKLEAEIKELLNIQVPVFIYPKVGDGHTEISKLIPNFRSTHAATTVDKIIVYPYISDSLEEYLKTLQEASKSKELDDFVSTFLHLIQTFQQKYQEIANEKMIARCDQIIKACQAYLRWKEIDDLKYVGHMLNNMTYVREDVSINLFFTEVILPLLNESNQGLIDFIFEATRNSCVHEAAHVLIHTQWESRTNLSEDDLLLINQLCTDEVIEHLKEYQIDLYSDDQDEKNLMMRIKINAYKMLRWFLPKIKDISLRKRFTYWVFCSSLDEDLARGVSQAITKSDQSYNMPTFIHYFNTLHKFPLQGNSTIQEVVSIYNHNGLPGVEEFAKMAFESVISQADELLAVVELEEVSQLK